MPAGMSKEQLAIVNNLLMLCAEGKEECRYLLECQINAGPELQKIENREASLQRIKALYFPDEP